MTDMNTSETPEQPAPANASSDLLAAIEDLDDLIKTERRKYDEETDHEWQRNQGFVLLGLSAARTLLAARRDGLLAPNEKLSD